MKYMVVFSDTGRAPAIVEASIVNARVEEGILFVTGYGRDQDHRRELITELIVAPGEWAYTQWLSE